MVGGVRTVKDAGDLRTQLAAAHLMLVFSPESGPGVTSGGLAAVEAALPWIDAIQIRVKNPDHPEAPGLARATFDLAERVLDLISGAGSDSPLVLVNDRVDVAAALADRGVDGVHLGQSDAVPATARGFLGPRPLIGVSTHSMSQVTQAIQDPVDYLGFGPVFPSATKSGHAGEVGPEAAWIASQTAGLPLFGIGGIDQINAGEIGPVRRAAVCAGILAAEDPGRAAEAIRAALLAEN